MWIYEKKLQYPVKIKKVLLNSIMKFLMEWVLTKI